MDFQTILYCTLIANIPLIFHFNANHFPKSEVTTVMLTFQRAGDHAPRATCCPLKSGRSYMGWGDERMTPRKFLFPCKQNLITSKLLASVNTEMEPITKSTASTDDHSPH